LPREDRNTRQAHLGDRRDVWRSASTTPRQPPRARVPRPAL